MNRCWCGRPSPVSGRCDQGHDPYDIYLCSCGLHLFSAEQSSSPGAWARHRAHIAEFQVRMQARVDVAIADAVSVPPRDVPDWAASAVAVLSEHGLKPC